MNTILQYKMSFITLSVSITGRLGKWKLSVKKKYFPTIVSISNRKHHGDTGAPTSKQTADPKYSLTPYL